MDTGIIFAGTPEFAAVHLQALLERGTMLSAVYTQPDRRAGRGQHLRPSPVRRLALAHGLEVHTPVNFADPLDVACFRALHPRLLLVVAYGILLPQAILNCCTCINVHASLLPKYRGAAPIQRALLDGQTTTGVTLMRMTLQLDAGDILLSSPCPIQPDDTALTLSQKLAAQGARLLAGNLDALLLDTLHGTPQDESQASYAHKLTKSEARLDFTAEPWRLERQVRALIPWPVATCRVGNQDFKVFEAQGRSAQHSLAPGTIAAIGERQVAVACRNGFLDLLMLQPPGRRAVCAAAYARSHPELLGPGQILGG